MRYKLSIRVRQRPEPEEEELESLGDPVEEKRHRRLLESASHHYCSLPGSNLWAGPNQWQQGIALPNMAERIGTEDTEKSWNGFGWTVNPERNRTGFFGWTVDPETGQHTYDGTLALMTAREQSEVQEALEALDPPQQIDTSIVASLIEAHQPELYRLRTQGWGELDSLLILIRSLWNAKRIIDSANYHRQYHEKNRDRALKQNKERYENNRDEILRRNRERYHGDDHDEIRERQNESRRQLRMLKAAWGLKRNRRMP